MRPYVSQKTEVFRQWAKLFEQWAKGPKEAANKWPTALYICFSGTKSTSQGMTSALHASSSGTVREIQGNIRRKKLNRTNLGSSFLGTSFSNRKNLGARIQFRIESPPQHLKEWIFIKNRPIHFHINSTSAIRLIKKSLVEIFQHWNQQATSIQCIYTVSPISDSSTEASSCCCHISDAEPHVE